MTHLVQFVNSLHCVAMQILIVGFIIIEFSAQGIYCLFFAVDMLSVRLLHYPPYLTFDRIHAHHMTTRCHMNSTKVMRMYTEDVHINHTLFLYMFWQALAQRTDYLY